MVEKLKKYLEDHGIKITWLSEKTNVNWNDRFLGRSKTKVEDIEKACEVLGIKISELEE